MASPPPQAAGLIDICANLLDPQYRGLYNGREEPYHAPDLDAVLARAAAAGVERALVAAGSLAEARAAAALARAGARVRLFCTAGLHPTRAREAAAHAGGAAAYFDELRAVLADGAADGAAVAVGECGLDWERTQFADAGAQRAAFAAHLPLAAAAGLPLLLHSRGAGCAAEVVAALRGHAYADGSGPLRGVVHSFDGSAGDLAAVLGAGLYVGLNGCSLKTEENLAVAAAVPLDRLLLETDCPWCEIRPAHAAARFAGPPPPARDRKKHSRDAPVKGRGEPAALARVLAAVAGARGADAADVAAAARANALRLFWPREAETE